MQDLQTSQVNIISILANAPEKLSEVEAAVTLNKVLESKMQVSALRRDNKNSLEFLISFLIEELIFALNVPELSEAQVAYITNTLINEYWYLKIEDFVRCFKNAKTAKYGIIYNRIDIHTICTWLNAYNADKTREIELLREQENTVFKKEKTNLLHLLGNGEAQEQEDEWDYAKIKLYEQNKAKKQREKEAQQNAEEAKRTRIAALRNKYFSGHNQ